MAEKVYVLNQIRSTEARWQLSEEELKSLMEKGGKALEEAGAKLLAAFRTYSSEWSLIRVVVFPDIEAYHKFRMAIGPEGLNIQRYWDFNATLGFELPA